MGLPVDSASGMSEGSMADKALVVVSSNTARVWVTHTAMVADTAK